MKRILVHGAGGAPTANFIRSLRLADEPFHFVGVDCDKFHLQRSEADKNYLMPYVTDPEYENLYVDLLEREKIDFIHCQIDQEIPFLSENRDRLSLPVFMPSHHAITVCQDKMQSYAVWRAAGLPVPRTILLHAEADLKDAFASMGPKLWIREIRGSGGRNALPSDSFLLVREWIRRHDGWGRFTAAECLTPETVTWMSVWKAGELVVAQTRKRLYWESANRSPAGVTGITGTGITCSDDRVTEVALAAIHAIEREPNGIYSIDLTYDAAGVPNPTENNVGRFFTTHFFFAKAGCNIPYIYTRLALSGEVPQLKKKINPLPDGLAWIRGMDVEPRLTTLDVIGKAEQELDQRKQEVCRQTIAG
jgi:hypothetical protein